MIFHTLSKNQLSKFNSGGTNIIRLYLFCMNHMSQRKIQDMDFYSATASNDYSHNNSEVIGAKLGGLLEVVLGVCNFNKSLIRMHRNGGTNRHMQYHVCSYHRLLLLLLGKGFDCTISSHVDCCTSLEEAELILEVKEALDILNLDINFAMEIELELMAKIKEINLKIQVDKAVKRVVLDKLGAAIKTMIKQELGLVSLNTCLIIVESLKQEVAHKMVAKVKMEPVHKVIAKAKLEVVHTLAIKQAIHIVNLDMVAFLVD